MARKKPWNVTGDKSEIVAAIPLACSDEAEAVAFMERQRGWDSLPACPRCGDTNVYQIMDRQTGERSKRFLWDCRGCRKQFTVRIGTVFEDSRIPLRHWCYAFWAACASKKGVSALQIKRQTGLSYKSALFLMHRIRFAMSDEPTRPLAGIVEVDETYVGGKPRYKTPKQDRKRGENPYQQGRAPDFEDRKTAVVAAVERGGFVRAMSPGDEHVTAKSLWYVMRGVDPSARIMTDEAPIYKGIAKHFGSHETVRHSSREYARGDVTTNTVEGFFSLLKRGIYGTFHSVSRRHLHRYVSEFQFRYNNRKVDDGERTLRAIRAAEGKRLLGGYRQPKKER